MNSLHPSRPLALLVLLAALAGCDSGRPGLPTAAPAGGTDNVLGSEQIRVEPSVLEFALVQPYGCCAPAAGRAAPAAGQAFTGSGVGAVKSGITAGGVGIEAGTTTKTVQLTNEGATPVAWSAADSVAWVSVSPDSGTLAAGASTTLNVTIDAELPSGFHYTDLVVTEGSATHMVAVLAEVATGNEISDGDVVNVSGPEYSVQYFVLSVPTGLDSLIIRLDGYELESGDADLYVRYERLPNFDEFNCRPYSSTSIERCKTILPAAGHYFIMVHAYTDFDGVTLGVTFFSSPGAPAAPGNVVAKGDGGLEIDVSWSDNSLNETLFRVHRSTRGPDGTFGRYQEVGTAVRNGTHFADHGLALGATYRYRVEACYANLCTTSPPSAPITVSPPPGATLLRARVQTGPRVDLSWTASNASTTAFRVRRSTRNPDGSYAPYVPVATLGRASTYSDTSVASGRSYRYRLLACNGFHGCSAPLAVNAIVPPAPATPTGLRASVPSAGRIDLEWADASSTEDSFRVRRSRRNPDGTFAPAQTLGTLPAGSTAFADTDVAPGNVYRYQVQACALGCAASTAVVAAVPSPPAAPTRALLWGVTPSRVNLLWTDMSTNESQFRVRRTVRRPDGTFMPYQTIATLGVGASSYSDTTVEAGRTYHYVVQACNLAGCGSSPSSGVSVPGS